jgi:hypothetical protein
VDPGLEGVEQYRGERRRLDPSLGSLVERGIHGDAGPHDVVGHAVADRGDGECFCAGLAPQLAADAGPTVRWPPSAGHSVRTRSSWLRDSMPRLVKTLRRWYWTVRALMNMRTPISGLDRPSRAIRAIWAS